MYGSLDVATSGMIAQRTRFETIATNIANASTAWNPKDPSTHFQRRVAYFAAGDPSASTAQGQAMGVHVAAIGQEGGFSQKYDPGNSYADADGMVKYPNVNIVMEQLDAYEAQRAYEANVTAAEGAKTMLAQALRLLA